MHFLPLNTAALLKRQ